MWRPGTSRLCRTRVWGAPGRLLCRPRVSEHHPPSHALATASPVRFPRSSSFFSLDT